MLIRDLILLIQFNIFDSMTILDKSNYFKGLILLARKDNIIAKQERELLQSVGKSLGFEENFCNDSINYILENEYVSKDPPKFSANRFT